MNITDEKYWEMANGKPPEGKHPKGEPIYCPYCKTWTHWITNDWGYQIVGCGCRFSDADFMIKKYNPVLWGSGKLGKKGRKTRKKSEDEPIEDEETTEEFVRDFD